MIFDSLTKLKGSKKQAKRVGRGIGSGKGGHTSGRGMKGQKSRSGYNLPMAFEGGQVPLYKRLPHLGGFKRIRRIQVESVSLDKFNKFEDGTKVTPEMLVKEGILKSFDKKAKVKVLANGDLTKKLEFSGFIFSESAKEKLEKSGSTVTE